MQATRASAAPVFLTSGPAAPPVWLGELAADVREPDTLALCAAAPVDPLPPPDEPADESDMTRKLDPDAEAEGRPEVEAPDEADDEGASVTAVGAGVLPV